MDLPEFKNEAEFREKWITPFLTRMGFNIPRHIHGAGEQGKDFFFADHDRFGHLRFYAAQVKLGNIGSGSRETDQLLNQVRRSFTVTLKHHKGANQQRISAVYIMASGKISDTAREYISDWCRTEHFGENVYYLDGQSLENMNRHATFESDGEQKERITALHLEVGYNRATVKQLKNAISGGSVATRQFRDTAMQNAMLRPFSIASIDINTISDAWTPISGFNGMSSVFITQRSNSEVVAALTESAAEIDRRLVKLEEACVSAYLELERRYSIEVVVESPAE